MQKLLFELRSNSPKQKSRHASEAEPQHHTELTRIINSGTRVTACILVKPSSTNGSPRSAKSYTPQRLQLTCKQLNSAKLQKSVA